MMQDEDRRKLLHMSYGLGALLLRYITQSEAIIFTFLAVLFNYLLMPTWIPGVLRPGEKPLKLTSGIIAYPLSILLLMAVTPWHKREIAAGVWILLAVGDSAAAWAGRKFKSPRLTWNRDKTQAGFFGFLLAGFPAALAVAWFVHPGIGINAIVQGTFVATVAAAIVETLPLPWNDNYSIVAAGYLAWMLLSYI
jgi:dolichol kinase